MPSPVFDQLNLISEDLDASVRFYRRHAAGRDR